MNLSSLGFNRPFLTSLAVCLAAGVLAAQTKRPPPEEEDPGDGVKRIVRPNEAAAPRKSVGPPIPREIDLVKAAQDAKLHPAFRKLCLDLSVPHDRLTIKTSDLTRTELVRPLRLYIGGTNKRVQGPIHIEPLKDNLQDAKPAYAIDDLSIVSGMLPYEALAREKVQEFRSRQFDKLVKDHPSYLSPLDKLLLVEQVLMAVARTHDSLRAQGIRNGADWDRQREELNANLLEVVLARLQLSIDRQDWEEAFALAQQTAGRFRSEAEHQQIAAKVAGRVMQIITRSLMTTLGIVP